MVSVRPLRPDVVQARPDAWGGVGVYATQRISSGELVERGVVQPLPVDGNICQYVFTWSEECRAVWTVKKEVDRIVMVDFRSF